MGKDPLSWIGEGAGTRRAKPARAEAPEVEEAPSDVQSQSAQVPKFMTLVPVTARLSEPQVEWLDTVERRIMRSRRRKRERITKNTLLRAAVEVMMALKCDYSEIADEAELVARVKKAARVG
jgi:hypothetical protein